jgi:acyl-coenzyme A synthetase/AMP-(fatty) acid ligase
VSAFGDDHLQAIVEAGGVDAVVSDCGLVRSKRNPVLGSVVVADVTLKTGLDNDADSEQIRQLKQDIMQFCSSSLAQHKVPVIISLVSQLTPCSTGKMVRQDA